MATCWFTVPINAIAGQPDESLTARSSPPHRSPLAFFLLVAAHSVPFALLGATGIQLYPGIPISALGFVAPVSAAAILMFRERGRAGIAELFRRAVDFDRLSAKGWYLPILFLMPAFALATWAIMRATGLPHPTPRVAFPATLVLFLAFIVAALGEELGWSGYAIDPLQHRFTALIASLIQRLSWRLVRGRADHQRHHRDRGNGRRHRVGTAHARPQPLVVGRQPHHALLRILHDRL